MNSRSNSRTLDSHCSPTKFVRRVVLNSESLSSDFPLPEFNISSHPSIAGFLALPAKRSVYGNGTLKSTRANRYHSANIRGISDIMGPLMAKTMRRSWGKSNRCIHENYAVNVLTVRQTSSSERSHGKGPRMAPGITGINLNMWTTVQQTWNGQESLFLI